MDTDQITLPQKRPKRFLVAIYLADLFLSFHVCLIVYVNSSFLGQFFSTAGLSLLFMAGAVLNLLLLLEGPYLMRKVGIYWLTLIFIILEGIAIVGMGLLSIPFFIALLFILSQAVSLVLSFNLDIFLENSTTNENKTGEIRGFYLTITSIILVICPTITGFILTKGNYPQLYLISAIFLLPLFFIAHHSFEKQVAVPKKIKMLDALREVLKNRDLHGVFMAQIILQIFYCWMVIYMPIYLHTHLQFSWGTIGKMFTIMLLPFALFELPLGEVADKKSDEREIMTIGFIIMGLFVALIAFLDKPYFLVWAIVLFMTRVGASFVEISSESYFFKQVNASDPDTISLFRMTRPLAFIVTPVLAAGTFFLINYFRLPYGLSFLILALIIFCAIRYTLLIRDIHKI